MKRRSECILVPRSSTRLVFLLAPLLAVACTAKPAASPKAPGDAGVANALVKAIDAEALEPRASASYLDVVDAAAQNPDDPTSVAVLVAAVDALVDREVVGMDDAGDHAVAFRSRELVAGTVARLRTAWASLGTDGETNASASLDDLRKQPAHFSGRAFMRGTIARALHELALYTGEEPAARFWGERRGCAMEASVVGPIDWAPLAGLDARSPVASAPRAPLAASYAGVAPFAARVAPIAVRADACAIDVNAVSPVQGVRAVVVDLDNPRTQPIHLALTTSSAAVLEVGGTAVLRRGFESGSRNVTRFASVQAEAGRVRVVARVAQKNDGNNIEIDAWGDDGAPLRARAPRVGDAASARVAAFAARELTPDALTGGGVPPAPAVVVASAAALLAVGESRAAEHLLEPAATGPLADEAPRGARSTEAGRIPTLELLYARALEQSDDLPPSKATERERAAVERVLAAWPAAWEAKIAHARLTERRRGAGEGVVEAFKELGVTVAGAAAPPRAPLARGLRLRGPTEPPGEAALKTSDPMIAAYVAIAARRAQMLDVAESAYDALERIAPASPLLSNVDAKVHRRVGADLVKAACAGGTNRSETACVTAHADQGDYAGALKEITRLRALRGSPDALRDIELRQRLYAGDYAGALAVYDAMAPGQRRLAEGLALAAGRGDRDAVRARLARDRAVARDVPNAIGPLYHVLGLDADATRAYEEEGRALIEQDRKAAFLPGAGTAVLRHVERYAIEPDGLVRFTMYDLRRVSGTADVAAGGAAFAPMIEGRGAPRVLRRRIHKKDGRVLEPDAAAYAAQMNSDLSQLEQGDYVEHLVEGWMLPGDSGQLVIDTPDLLPERTSLRDAEIEVRRPAAVPFSVWAHPLLGRAEQRRDGAFEVSVWRLKNQAPRRLEDGVPKMERSVCVSLGTQTWANVARAIDENMRALTDRDPYVARWAKKVAEEPQTASGTQPASQPATGQKPDRRTIVERVVAAAGKTVKVAQGGDLSDAAAVFGGGGQNMTARTILEQGQGSRSWVIYRALRELGVPADLAIAEIEPFSASADFPAHVGRFQRPLVIAHLGGPGGDVWIDADVEGPPAPPGRISPELRGRSAILANGKIVTVTGTAGERGDEVDVRLKVDEKGDARGTFTVMLHGRAAQSLADALETVVGTERRQMLQGVVLGWLPWADVDDVLLSSSEGSWEVALRASVSIHGYARPEGKDGKIWVLPGLEPVHFVFPRAFVGTLGATYASRGARQSALSIESSLAYHVHRRVELPSVAEIVNAPSSLKVSDPGIEATRTVGTQRGSAPSIEEEFALSLPTGTVAAERYQTFVGNVQTVDDGFMAGARVKVKRSP